MAAIPQAIAFQRRPVSTLVRVGAGRDMFRLSTLAGRACVVADPALAHDVLHAPDRYRAGSANRRILPVLPHGTLLTLDGTEHRARRRLLAPLFRGDALAAMRPVIRDIAATELAAWPIGRAFALLPRTRFVALRIAARLLLGIEGAADAHRLERYLTHAVWRASAIAAIDSLRGRWLGAPVAATCCPAGFAGALAKARDVRGTRRSAPDAVDLLRASFGGAGGHDEQRIADELFALLLAGHETTAGALAWALELLARDPDTAAAIAREASAGERPLLDSVIAEVLRLRPPLVDIVREVGEPIQLGPQRLASGTLLLIPPPLIHRHAQPAPQRFIPTRFVGGRPDPMTWVPFGGGDRRCLGASLALLELREILPYVLERFELEPASRRPEAARLHGTALVPARGARITLRPRRAGRARDRSRGWQRSARSG